MFFVFKFNIIIRIKYHPDTSIDFTDESAAAENEKMGVCATDAYLLFQVINIVIYCREPFYNTNV